MKVLETKLEGCFIIQPKIFEDNRGYFFESFNSKQFQEMTKSNTTFVQDNESYSTKGVLRGLHYQTGIHAQAKLVRVVKGKVLDVAVDLRKGSQTFGKHVSVELTEDNKKQLFVPRGFAHGFSVLSENAVFAYTGTQHHVELVDNLDHFPVFEKGKEIRYSYDTPGSNVNFAQKINETTFRVRTYEKGVENETLACGTGVTAVAIAMHKTGKTTSNLISLPVEGGNLEVSFSEKDGIYTNVFLKGPATFVFKGEISF